MVPANCIAGDGGMALFADGEESAIDGTFEREIGLTGEYKTRDFSLSRKQFEEAAANHKASGVDPAVDRGHETWLGADPGTEARGWVRALTVRPSALQPNRDALVATIELNDLGRNAVANKHFRYLSMGINLKGVDRQTGKPIGAVLDHLALVKRPFIEGMQPLSLSADYSEQENHMLSTLKALGLKDDASEGEALSAVENLKAQHAALVKASGKDSHDEALGSIEAYKASHAQFEALSAEVAAIKAEKVAAEFAALCEKGANDKKLTPFALKSEWIAGMKALGEAGIAQLASYLEVAPVLANGSSEKPVGKVEAASDIALSAEEHAYCARYGIDPVAMAATKANKAAAL